MNAPEIRDSALESHILAAAENLQQDMVELATTLVRFPSLNGDEAGAQDFMESLFRDESVSIESTLRVAQVLALFMARWCGVEKSR